MRIMLALAFGFTAAGCRPDCTLGVLQPVGETFKALQDESAWAFVIGGGSCTQDQLAREATVRVVLPDSTSTSAELSFGSSDDQYPSAGPPIVKGWVHGFTPMPGSLRIELSMRGDAREWTVGYADTLPFRASREAPADCHPPIWFRDSSVICNSRDLQSGGTRVLERTEDGAELFLDDARLWATSHGRLMAVNGRLGWLEAGQSLRSWTGQVAVPQVHDVATSDEYVFVLSDAEIQVLDATDLSAVVDHIPLGRSVTEDSRLTATGPGHLVLSLDSLALDDVERRLFVRGPDGWLLHSSERDGARTFGAGEGLFWTCNERTLAVRRPSEVGEEVVAEHVLQHGACTSDLGTNDRATVIGHGFFICPSLIGREISMTAIARRSSTPAGCWENYAYLRTGAQTPLMDLRR